MKTKKISAIRINRIREQGYHTQSGNEICNLAVGNRFAYQACVSILIVGVATANIPLISVMFCVALLGVILPNHPFDYIYNKWVKNWTGGSVVPTRSPQLKFACGLATIFISVTIYFFLVEMMLAGYITGGTLIVVGLLVSTIDLCIPSIIYNNLIMRKKRAMKQDVNI